MWIDSGRYRKISVLASLMLGVVLCGVCWGQPPKNAPPPPPTGDGGPGPGFGPPGPGREFWSLVGSAYKQTTNNRRDLWRLVEHPAIQAEIGLDAAEFKSLDDLNRGHFDQIRERRDEFEACENKDSFFEAMVQLLQQQDDEFTAKLSAACNFDRLIEIDVQAMGERAAVQNVVASRIGLSAEKLADLREHSEEVRREEMAQMDVKIRDIMRNGGGRKVREVFGQIDQTVNQAVKMRLSSQQLDALNELKGKAFALPDDLFDRRRRPQEKNNDRREGKKGGQQNNDCVHKLGSLELAVI